MNNIQSSINSSGNGGKSWIIIEDVFREEVVEQLRQRLFGDTSKFVSTEFDADGKPRNSVGFRKLLVAFRADAPILRDKIIDLLPRVRDELGIKPFRLGKVESRASLYLDGYFIKRHTDSSQYPDIRSLRTISCVYYLHREPRKFSGGELCLYEGETEKVVYKGLPPPNSLMFFPCSIYHEVTQVSLAHGVDPLDGRCAVVSFVSESNLVVEFANIVKNQLPTLINPIRLPVAKLLRRLRNS